MIEYPESKFGSGCDVAEILTKSKDITILLYEIKSSNLGNKDVKRALSQFSKSMEDYKNHFNNNMIKFVRILIHDKGMGCKTNAQAKQILLGNSIEYITDNEGRAKRILRYYYRSC